MRNPDEEEVKDELLEFESRYKNLTKQQFADQAVKIATNQIIACTDFKAPRIKTLQKYWTLYDGKTTKKLRQLFNIAIPVFPGMIDTLNAQYDTPIQLEFTEGDPADYFKVQKINSAFQMEIMNTATNSKWDSKLRMARKHAIMNGVGIVKYTTESDPQYKSVLENVHLNNYIFQPKGGLYLENHLFNGEEDIEKTKSELIRGAREGLYDRDQVKQLIAHCEDRDYLPQSNINMSEKLDRFKPLGVDADTNSYVGESVYKLTQQILEIDGKRYFLLFHPWSQTWLRFERWGELCSSDLYPWDKFATHEDDENFLSKSYGDDIYTASDAIVAMFNQEMTNREKRNFGARAYDEDMFKDVAKLDEAMHRPDALVPADTQGGAKRIGEGIYEFKVGELGGTVNLIDWITGSLGRNTGATDMSMGSVQEVSKKASVAFAEQKAVSKRIGWASAPFQEMMASIGKKYIYGLKDDMPSKMAIKILGEHGWDWDEITRLDLNTTKDIDVLIKSTDYQELQDNMKLEKRKEALAIEGLKVNEQWRTEEILRSIGSYDDVEIAVAMDTNTYSDRKSLAHAAKSIQMILQKKKPDIWYGATPAFMQKIVDFAQDHKATLKEKYETLIEYASAHIEIAKGNVERQASQDKRMAQQQAQQQVPTGLEQSSTAENPGMSGGQSRAMSIANNAIV